jgi:hypothetical protein
MPWAAPCQRRNLRQGTPGHRWQAGLARKAACGPSTASGAAAVRLQRTEPVTGSNEAQLRARGSQLALDAPAATCLRRKTAFYQHFWQTDLR